jgi:hypothetical protein
MSQRAFRALVVYLSSTRATGNPNRPSSWRAKRSARAVISCGVPSSMHGKADHQHVRLPLLDQCRDRGESGCIGVVRDRGARPGDAEHHVADRNADPARPEIEREDRGFVVRPGGRHASCVSDVVGQAREIDAEKAHGGR